MARISDIIAKLQALKWHYGDLEVYEVDLDMSEEELGCGSPISAVILDPKNINFYDDVYDYDVKNLKQRVVGIERVPY